MVPAVFPRLRKTVKFKKLDDYVVVYDSHPSRIHVIHPSHALLLSLCTGSYSLEEVSYLFRETYNLVAKDASETVLAVTNRLRTVLEFLEKPD